MTKKLIMLIPNNNNNNNKSICIAPVLIKIKWVLFLIMFALWNRADQYIFML